MRKLRSFLPTLLLGAAMLLLIVLSAPSLAHKGKAGKTPGCSNCQSRCAERLNECTAGGALDCAAEYEACLIKCDEGPCRRASTTTSR
jgi:hypothetical protein